MVPNPGKPRPKVEARRHSVYSLEQFGTAKSSAFFGRITAMARKAKKKRWYSKSSGSDVKSEMRSYKKGKAKSGRGGKGGKVKSRRQAIAIGLSKARKKDKKVPKKKS